ncbi:MAG: rhodanese-like domain-containing protein [Thermoplasmata archaeon]|nr:MAG: rhodanese-like domain-containing protein [Thermoplasmata archaeon]RLF45448.1 MAG: hypothetical protein DRN17_02540 [Thermoplasmata archaeon]RLF64421.1 MAG: hypothetical protein DRN31_00200 [Thermoplasmata archaeon]
MKKEAIFIALLLLITVIPVYQQSEGVTVTHSKQEGLINITAQEAWEMLNNEDDGIQIPVDVRTLQEYFDERISSPHSYDKPVLYPLQLLEMPLFANLFVKLFHGKEVILYCRTARRSGIAGNIILEGGYDGTLYNMIGGIVAWKDAGLPTVKGFGFGS